MIQKQILFIMTVLALLVTTVSAQSYEFPKMIASSNTIAATVGRNAAAADTIAMANILKIIAEQSPGRNMNFNTYFDDEISPDLIGKYDWIVVGSPSINSVVRMFTSKKLPMNTVELSIHQNPYDRSPYGSSKIVMVFNGAENREALVLASKTIETAYLRQGLVKLAPVNCISENTIIYSPCSDSTGKNVEGDYTYLKHEKEPMTNMPYPTEPLKAPLQAPAQSQIQQAPSFPEIAMPAKEPRGQQGIGGDQAPVYDCGSSCKMNYEKCMTQEMVGIEKVCNSELESCINSCSKEPVYPKKSMPSFDGCKLNHGTDRIAPYGTRLLNEKNEPVYCDIDSGLKPQKKPGESAQNNYECESNAATNGKCLDVQAQISMLQKIFKFFSRIFGGE